MLGVVPTKEARASAQRGVIPSPTAPELAARHPQHSSSPGSQLACRTITQ